MLEIEMTGREDLEDPWKIAVAGFPGAGKTLLSSTAPKPLFVFFEANPRLKSIAHRHIPHVKLTNSSDGQVTVQDQLNALAMSLQLQDHDYETIVLDTGDELLQRMKEARRIKNGGEFNIGDWSWLGDAYREVVTGIIDLPVNVIITYHLKSAQDGEDGVLTRELALQGAAKDEAPGWFDVVGVLDTFETADEQGDAITKRVLLTHSSRTYPWVKDHSGQLPVRWPISEKVVGDVSRLLKTLSQSAEGFQDGQEHQVIGTIDVPDHEETVSGAAVPAPDDLQAKKAESRSDNGEVASEAISPESKPAPSTDISAGSEGEGQEAEPADAISEESEKGPESTPAEPEPDPEPESDKSLNEPDKGQDEESTGPSPEEAQATLESELGAEQVFPCAVCQENVTDEDLRDLTQIRFRKIYCRTHFKEQLAAARA